MRVLALLAFLLMAAPAAAQGPTALKVSFLTAGAAHGMDLSTTAWCRAQGTCTELNPALRWAQDNPLALGAAKMTFAGALLLGTYKVSRSHPKVAFWVNVAQTVAFSYVAARNVRFTTPRH